MNIVAYLLDQDQHDQRPAAATQHNGLVIASHTAQGALEVAGGR